MGTTLLGDVPNGDNGFAAQPVSRALQGASKEVVAPVVGQITAIIRPLILEYMDKPIGVNVRNLGPNSVYFRFTKTGEVVATPPGTTHCRLASGSQVNTCLLADEDGVLCSATTADSTLRFEFYNLDL